MKSRQTVVNGAVRWPSILLAMACLSLSGCGDLLPELVPFGSVSTPDQYRSINGLGVHRKMWETAGAKVLTPQKLSPKLDSIDVIVLVGQTFEPPGKAARQWLEGWLARESGRTLIYFGRDFSADVYYREQTLSQLPIDEQPRAKQLLALAQSTELAERLSDLPESTFCDWFFVDVDQAPQQHSTFDGKWSSELSGLDGHWPTRSLLQPPRSSYKSRLPSWLKGGAKPATNINLTVDPFEDAEVTRSTWTPEELDSKEAWDTAFRNLPSSETLVASDSGQPLLFRLTNSKKYRGSQILIATNGAPLLNGSLVEPLHQRVGELLIEEALPAKRVALLAYDHMGLLISNIPESDARGAGLEMLMLWPLSAITIPAAILGVVVCAVLLPILGRPQALPQRSVSDFGLHVEALGMMLQETRDIDFAKTAVRDYFQKVRGEAPPIWLDQLGNHIPSEAQSPLAPSTEVKNPLESPSESRSSAPNTPQ